MYAPKLGYPIKPFRVVQAFGSDPKYYARFHDDFGQPEKGHMGVDLQASHGQPVYAPCDGLISFQRDAHGGEGMYLVSEPFDFNGQQMKLNIILWHLVGDTDASFPSPIPLDGKQYPVKRGDLVGYADNSGAPYESSGDHLHTGVQLLDRFNTIQNQRNGFNGCIDPMPFFDGTYAQDARRDESYVISLLAHAWRLLAAKFPGRSAPPTQTLS